MRIGIATDNYRLQNRPLEYCLDHIAKIGCKFTELNMIHGFEFFEGLGFTPNVSNFEDPLRIRDMVEKRGITISQCCCHYPLWSYRCVDYMRMGILFADQLGCEAIATTDSDKLPADMTEEDAFVLMKHHLGETLKFAERHKIKVLLEPHGKLTNHPDKMKRLVTCHDSELLGINFDTGNTFVCGWEPQEFLAKLIDKVHHCHVKDVAPELADERRGEDTGIASSDVYVGEGVNADNIIECLKIFKKNNYKGVLSLECGGEALTEKSFTWLTQQVNELK
jgi:sugar phosphate isomerase/epimerase